MECIIFIGTRKSGSSFEALTASCEMNYYTILLTDNTSYLKSKSDFQAVNLMRYCDLHDLDDIRYNVSRIRKSDLDIRAIVSFTDEHCYIANLIAKEFRLNYFTLEAIKTMKDKIRTRRAIQNSPYSPFFRIIKHQSQVPAEIVNQHLPVVLKEPMSTGSKGVVKVNTYDEYERKLSEILKKSQNSSVLLEEYLDGPQFLVETLTVNNNVHIAAVIKQEISYSYRFIVTGYKVITDYENCQSLLDAVDEIIHLIGLRNGSCHLELRYVKDQWKLIEINPRISGGIMNTLIQTAYGINLVKETLELATGRKPDLKPRYIKEVYVQYIVVDREGILTKVTGRGKALSCQGVERVSVKPRKGQLIIPPLSMGYRYAYVIATGDTAQKAIDNAKYAANQIKFYIKEIDGELLPLLSKRQRDTLNLFYRNRMN